MADPPKPHGTSAAVRRARKRELEAHREEKMFALADNITKGFFSNSEIALGVLAALLGAGAAFPFRLMHGYPEGYRDGNGTTAEWYSTWTFDSMSQKILSQTYFDLKIFGLSTGGGIKTMTGSFDLVWTGPDPTLLPFPDYSIAVNRAWEIGKARAIAYLLSGGAMAGFMGLQTIRILGGVLSGMMKQDFIPTP